MDDIKLGNIEKVPLGQGFCFVIDQIEVAVFRPRSGGLCAIANRCPHRQAPLAEGLIDQKNVVCPYHGHKFDLHTGEGSEVGEKVKVYEVREEEEEIRIKI